MRLTDLEDDMAEATEFVKANFPQEHENAMRYPRGKKMSKQSREQIIAELDARQIPYSEDMGYNELCELLKQAPTAPMEHRKIVPPQPEEPIDYSNIRCGLSTIQDLHRRITILERFVANLLARPPVPIMMIQGKDAK